MSSVFQNSFKKNKLFFIFFTNVVKAWQWIYNNVKLPSVTGTFGSPLEGDYGAGFKSL